MAVLFYPVIRKALSEEVTLSRDMKKSPKHWYPELDHVGSQEPAPRSNIIQDVFCEAVLG